MEKRQFKKLRISLTNLCNLACSYCVPAHYSNAKSIPEIISLDPEKSITQKSPAKLKQNELLCVIESLHNLLDLNEVRLTGGEPLLYHNLPELIQSLKNIGIDKIGMTSNAYLLPFYADKLKAAGLKSVNISLDAIDEEVFFAVTRKRYLSRVLTGIDKALNTGLTVKLNAVIMRDINHNQILPLIEYANSKKITIRFIELMKMGHLFQSNSSLFYSANEILTDIKSKYNIELLDRKKSSTANYWKLDNGHWIGIIANEGFPFCSDCDRLRIDEYGRIYGCISSNKGFETLQYVDDPLRLKTLLKEALHTKQNLKFQGSSRSMINVGG